MSQGKKPHPQGEPTIYVDAGSPWSATPADGAVGPIENREAVLVAFPPVDVCPDAG